MPKAAMRGGSVRAACLQLNPGNNLNDNLRAIEALLREAIADGAQLIAIPEFGTFLDRRSSEMKKSASREEDSAALCRLRQLAKEHQVWLLVGSIVISESCDNESKLLNRSFLISPQGVVRASYDKIHLFDACLSSGRTVRESQHYRPGNRAVLVRTPFGSIGMTICYDLRFPELYRRLALAGADILLVPSAFAEETGRYHWEPLLRARAIENGCFILAPATFGEHPGNWKTYGHAAIVDPWGTFLAQCSGTAPGIAAATLRIDRVAQVRSTIPSLSTNPDFSVVECFAD